MDYTAVGQTKHLAARMEEITDPGASYNKGVVKFRKVKIGTRTCMRAYRAINQQEAEVIAVHLLHLGLAHQTEISDPPTRILTTAERGRRRRRKRA